MWGCHRYCKFERDVAKGFAVWVFGLGVPRHEVTGPGLSYDYPVRPLVRNHMARGFPNHSSLGCVWCSPASALYIYKYNGPYRMRMRMRKRVRFIPSCMLTSDSWCLAPATCRTDGLKVRRMADCIEGGYFRARSSSRHSFAQSGWFCITSILRVPHAVQLLVRPRSYKLAAFS